MIMLDTCAIVWDALEPNKLSDKAKNAINKADEFNALIISDISIWEISMLIKRNRLSIESSASHFINLYLQTRNVSVVQISPEIAELSVNLDESINKDPADRIISATAIIQNARLVTADKNLIASEIIETVW